MKSYTQEEINAAIRGLPAPLRGFIFSPSLRAIFIGIRDKHKLNLRQIWAVSELSTTTLAGLDSQTAFESNLHLLLPELSNATTHELVADVNSRIFKEARRRLEEEIIEPHTEQNETSEDAEKQRREEERIKNLDDDDPELVAIVEKERLASSLESDAAAVVTPTEINETEEDEVSDDEAELLDLLEKIEVDPETPLPKSSAELELQSEFTNSAQQVTAPTLGAKNSSSSEVPQSKNFSAQPAAMAKTVPPLVAQKLSAPSIAIAETRIQQDPTAAIQGIKKIAPPNPRLKGDSDPYRETVD